MHPWCSVLQAYTILVYLLQAYRSAVLSTASSMYPVTSTVVYTTSVLFTAVVHIHVLSTAVIYVLVLSTLVMCSSHVYTLSSSLQLYVHIVASLLQSYVSCLLYHRSTNPLSPVLRACVSPVHFTGVIPILCIPTARRRNYSVLSAATVPGKLYHLFCAFASKSGSTTGLLSQSTRGVPPHPLVP